MAYNGGPNGHVAHDSGTDVNPKDERLSVLALEEENHRLREKTAAASLRFADYENDIRSLQARLRQTERRNAELERAKSPTAENPAQPEKPALSRFGSFMGARKAPVAQTNASPAREHELETALVKEQTARLAAEKKVKEVNAEIEELSATLFQQANEMVASERKENAILKRKLGDLERTSGHDSEARQVEIGKLRQKVQTLEQREVDRRKRIERLENAQKRIDRVRTMLLPR